MKKNNPLAWELEMDNAVSRYKDEAVKIAIAAFNEGYMLGRKHAKSVFGGKQNGGR